MASNAAVERFLHAVETATIPSCDAWSADATLDECIVTDGVTVPAGARVLPSR